ncbi:antitoxin [Aureimonas psammosilenae]|uniref:antitoxin n=1 Tax=Aureimonas psammosilenae TaxID=2495496 RepID=UPI001260D575|nr:AbrB/MazE/SpoVT family DNA-binding domain-containing protein [Aureimonas psammosilenae]
MSSVKQEQRARVFRNGRSRAVRIPKEFDFEGDEVTIRREADGTLRILPDRKEMTPAELVAWLRSLPPLSPEEMNFPDIDDLPPKPVDFDGGS